MKFLWRGREFEKMANQEKRSKVVLDDENELDSI